MAAILIVDDSPSRYEEFLPKICPKYLASDNVHFVTNLRDAIDSLKKERYDVLILDILIPEAPWGQPGPDVGAKLLEHIEEDDEIKRPKYIVGVTAAQEDAIAVAQAFDSTAWTLIRTGGAGSDWIGRLLSLVSHAMDAEQRMDAGRFSSDICFITALREPEQEALLACDLAFEQQIPVDTATYVRKGQLQAKGKKLSVVAACCSRMGSTEAALLTYKMINNFRPKLVLMTGICAGVQDKANFGDVVVASRTWDWTSSKISVDASGDRVVYPAPDYIEVNRDVLSRFEVLREDTEYLAKLQKRFQGDSSDTVLKIHIGALASGPMVVADGKTMKEIKEKQNRELIGLDMESYGVYAAARIASRPRPMVVSVKSVCDFGDYLKNDKYQKYASYTSANVAFTFLQRFGGDLSELADGS